MIYLLLLIKGGRVCREAKRNFRWERVVIDGAILGENSFRNMRVLSSGGTGATTEWRDMGGNSYYCLTLNSCCTTSSLVPRYYGKT